MGYYIQDIFYKLDHLSLNDKKNLLRDAKKLSYFWHIDILEESSISRKRIKYARFESFLKKLDEKTYFVFIKRGGYFENLSNVSRKWYINSFCIQTGVRTMTTPDYFIFIDVDLKHLDYFKEKYRLNETL